MRAVFFEIPVADLERAGQFYAEVFDVALRPEHIDGLDMLFIDDDGDGGATGALVRGETYVPSVDGTRVYIEVADISQVLARATTRGGRVLYPPTQVSADLVVAELADPDGNRVALSERVPQVT